MDNSVLIKNIQLATIGGGETKNKIQYAKGKLTARERINLILDQNSFHEIGIFVKHRCNNFGMDKKQYFTDGVITGYGEINKRTVCIYSQDFTILGGSLGEYHAKKISYLIQQAIKMKVPIIGINDSGGARIQEGIDSLSGYGCIFQQNVLASGIIPQITLIMGPCAGGAVYSPALTDFIFMIQNSSYMFVTGPEVVKTVTGENVTQNELGGANVHTSKSGVSDLSFKNEIDAIIFVRKFLLYLPSSCEDKTPYRFSHDTIHNIDNTIKNIIPDNKQQPYDMKEILYSISDENEFTEIQQEYAKNLIIGFSHIGGYVVGYVANQPLHLAGCLDIHASRKGARFIRFCNAFNIPIITFVDVPGFLPGKEQEHHGIIKYGAKLLYAYAEATVTKITIITRKAYGGAYIVMNSKHLNGDYNCAWTNSEIAVMGAESAAKIIFKEDTQNKIKEYKNTIMSPLIAASRGYIDEIIQPEETRYKIFKILKYFETKRINTPHKKHGNIPL